MGVTGALSLAGAAMSAYGSIQQGQAEKAQAEANAAIYEAQVKNIKEAQKITAGQYRTKEQMLRGQATVNAARNGVKISGTTASSISQSIMELEMDNSYEQYNLQLKKYNAYSNAELERYKGKQAMSNAYLNAGKTALNASVDYYSKYWKGGNTANKNLLSGGVDYSSTATVKGQQNYFPIA